MELIVLVKKSELEEIEISTALAHLKITGLVLLYGADKVQLGGKNVVIIKIAIKPARLPIITNTLLRNFWLRVNIWIFWCASSNNTIGFYNPIGI